MKEIIQIINSKSWQDILQYSKSLSDSDRFATIEKLKKIDIDEDILKKDKTNLTGKGRTDYYKNRKQIDICHSYFLITCTRCYEDLKLLERAGFINPLHRFISTNNYQPLIDFYKLFPPDYLDKVIDEISKDSFRSMDFKILWKLYENKWISFDEELFIQSLLIVPMFDRNTMVDAQFLFDNKEALENIFLKFYIYETPILDISKWEAREGFVCKKVYEFWTEVIILLQEKGYEFDRVIIADLLQSLLNNWKKGHLDWHVRLLKLFKPTVNEYIENQSTLFSILGTGYTSLINYAMQSIKKIHKHKDFDKTLFVENFSLIFSVEKATKSILTGLDILESFLSQSFEIEIDYRENLAILLMQADSNIQEKVSQMLVDYFNNETLKDSVEPYVSYLKQKSKDILELSDAPETSLSDAFVEKELIPIKIITNWDDLLLHIGTCIRTKSSTDIEVFYESLNKLQSEIPSDFEKQLKPYTKQLSNRFWENHTMLVFSQFIASWIKKEYSGIEDKNSNPIPFFTRKSELLLSKLKRKNSLPFLSTPTHNPFYVHPVTLVDKLTEYEKCKEEVDLEDLIVACNRVFLSGINEEAIAKSKKLNGYYSEAIQYLFGANQKIKYNDFTLPLWTQITRIKNPDGVFHEFENSSASDYPTVVKPFDVDYKVNKDENEYLWLGLILTDNWNFTWYNKEKAKLYDHVFYNTASTDKAIREDIPFQLSLNPNYLGPQLCRYIPDTATGNEVREFEECLFPMQFILEHQLNIHHSGWLYVAACLLFEKKTTRDLASEYILLAISRKENLDYLAKSLGTLISDQYAPVNRFIEYLDKPNNIIEIKHFQYKVLYNCILSFDKDQLPRNSKKIIVYYKEWLNSLQLELPEIIEEKLAKLKK